MNKYEKMTLASFVANLKAKKYADATGARRAVGKSQELSNADKDKARAEINKFFGVAGPKKAAKKIAPKAKAAPKKAAKKVVAKPAAKSKATRVKRQPAPPVAIAEPTSAEASVMRQHAASQIFNSLYGKAPLEPELEAKLLRASALEYLANVSIADGPRESSPTATPAISKKERVARPRVPVAPKAEAPAVETAPASEEKVNGAPIDMTGWTPEQIAQYEQLSQLKAEHEKQ